MTVADLYSITCGMPFDLAHDTKGCAGTMYIGCRSQNLGAIRFTGNDHGKPGGKWHGFEETRLEAARDALEPMLAMRAHYGVHDFDVAIRELTGVLCYGAQDSVQKLVREAPLEELYPLGEIGRCHTFVCGGCSTVVEPLYGAAFTAFPKIDSQKVPYPGLDQ